MISLVDPFIGTDTTNLPPQEGLAATWWWPKPQVGNTHPGATYPLGMVSACPYSGAYPTGYGLNQLSTEGVPNSLYDNLVASGFTHFQQSGTGAIRKYYNYARITPMVQQLDQLGDVWPISDETASPGYYGATLGSGVRGSGVRGSGIRSELTVGPKSAVHRYTFPARPDARLVLDFSLGGLAIDHGQTVPLRAHLHSRCPGVAQAEIVVEGVPLSVYIEFDAPEWRQMLWYDRRLMPGGTTLDFDYIRPTTLRPFGLLLMGPTDSGQPVELRLGFSLRGVEQAKQNLYDDCGTEATSFDLRRSVTEKSWKEKLDRIRVEGGSTDRRTIFSTSVYHSLIKPCFAPDESPFWSMPGPFVFDVCTMWDIYKTQLPLLTAIAPEKAKEMVSALLFVFEQEGNLPVGYRMARGADRFFRQGSALAHTFFADVCALGLTGIDWEWVLVHMHSDLRRNFGEEYLEKGVAHPISHTVDLSEGYYCTAKVARHLGDEALARQLEGLASQWSNAFDPQTGLLVDSTFYEGSKWNYSFRLLQDMASRISIAGGESAFVELLDRFFGYGAEPVKQLGVSPTRQELEAGYGLNRFEGLNNEPDMEAPWAYHYAGRPDRTAEVVHAAISNQFGLGRGGLPGNDDSGGLSSWYVWASAGLFPVAGQGLFFVNAPAFERARIDTGDSSFVVETDNFVEPEPDGPPQYVQSVRLNGKPLDRTWISSAELHSASRLQMTLGSKPSDWASDSRPPSIATRHC